MTADPATKLRALHAAAEQVLANLVELELDSGRQLLAASTLQGESAVRWSKADAALTELWRRHGLLQDLLERADRLQGGRHANELRDLLSNASIELASTEVPLVQRSLLGSAQSAERCTPDQLLAGMSAVFDEVKLVIAAIGQAWETLIPRLDGARRTLQDSRRLADEIGERHRGDLESVAGELETLQAVVSADPLAVQTPAVDAVVRILDEIHRDLEQSAGLKQGFDARALTARELLGQLRGTIREAQLAHEELQVKIAVPGAPPVTDATAELEARLTEITELARHGEWREAHRALEQWTHRTRELLAAADRALKANRAPIEARNQFRALLEAYQVKAKRLGRLEDPELAATFARAREALFTAPTDLAVAAQLVRRYQQALSAPAVASEEALK
jgi:hypothetical protein